MQAIGRVQKNPTSPGKGEMIFNLSIITNSVLVLCESFIFRIFENFVRQHYRQVVGVHVQGDL